MVLAHHDMQINNGASVDRSTLAPLILSWPFVAIVFSNPKMRKLIR